MVRRKRLLRSGCSNDVERSLKSEMRRDARRAAGRVRPNTQHEVNNAICVVLERCSEYEARNDENNQICENLKITGHDRFGRRKTISADDTPLAEAGQ